MIDLNIHDLLYYTTLFFGKEPLLGMAQGCQIQGTFGIPTALCYIVAVSKSNYEDLQNDIRDWRTPEIETFANVYSDKEYEIRMSIPEFTCLCPKTGLPDFAVLQLIYVPNQHCIELKSLKEYILIYRSKGIFHENLVNKIVEDLVKAVQPKSLRLEAVFHARGGIQTTVVRSYPSPRDDG